MKTATKKKSKPQAEQKPQNGVSKADSGINEAAPVSKDTTDTPNKEGASGFRTIGSMMGEIVWLMSQSPTHKFLPLSDLEWLLMPPIILGQYKIFRDPDKKPVGAALWGYLNEDAEKRLKAAGKLAPQDWGNNAKLDQKRGLVASEGGTLWLVELITPFHSKENKHREQVLTDLMNTAFKGKQVKMIHINPETRQREEITITSKNDENKSPGGKVAD